MDRQLFDSRIAKLKTGEFLNDPSVFVYANDNLLEYRALFDALRTCCQLQKGKIEMLRQMNRALEKSLRDGHAKIAELEQTIIELSKQTDVSCPDQEVSA